MGVKASFSRPDFGRGFDTWRRESERKIERAILDVTDRGARRAVLQVRQDMAAAGLGRLGNALGNTSDKAKGRGVHRTPGGFSASGAVFIRSGSPRSRGAIEAYTQGADIRPVRSRLLWYPSDDIQRVAGAGAGRKRLTPGNWAEMGMEAKLGPLVRIKTSKGPVLIVKNVGVSLSGKRGSANSLTKKGLARKGQVAREFIVAFIGIPRTTRAARVDVAAIMRSIAAELPALFNQAVGKV